MDGDWVYHTEAEAHTAGMAWPHPIVSLVANFSTSETSASNGATEIWPGSHHVAEVATAPRTQAADFTAR